jgi:hypothetical protein
MTGKTQTCVAVGSTKTALFRFFAKNRAKKPETSKTELLA